MLIQNEAMGAATASGGRLVPAASYWVRIMTSCINIKRGELCSDMCLAALCDKGLCHLRQFTSNRFQRELNNINYHFCVDFKGLVT